MPERDRSIDTAIHAVKKVFSSTPAKILLASGLAFGTVSGCSISEASGDPTQNLKEIAQNPCGFENEHVTVEGFPEYLGVRTYISYGLRIDFGGGFGPGLVSVAETSYKLHVNEDISSSSVDMVESEQDAFSIGGVPETAIGSMYKGEIKVDGTVEKMQFQSEDVCVLNASSVKVLG